MFDPNLVKDPQYVVDIIARRRWFIILPFCLAMLAGIYVVITTPKIYTAETMILVQGQQVPTDYVRSIVDSDINSRVATLQEQILSRSNLEKIIANHNLYTGPEYAGMYIEDKLNNFRNRTSVSVSRSRRSDSHTFTITFKGKDPQKTAQIANSLADSFIIENLKVREAQAVGTSQFLDAELANMRKRLEEVEQQLKNYRETYMGGLPEQLQSNLQVLSRLQEQLNNRRDNLTDARNRLIAIEREIAEGQDQVAEPGQAIPESAMSLSQLKSRLKELQTRYTDQHPDIARLKARIAEAEAEQASVSVENATVPYTEEMRQREEIRLEIASLQNEIAEINRQIDLYQKRVEDTPKREQELLSLQRDYDNISLNYNSLLDRKLEAELAVNLEKKKQGEQFRVIDPAKTPNIPSEPDMRKIFLMFVAAGLGIGCGLALAIEFLDKSFRKPEEIQSMLDIKLFSTIPWMETRREKLLRRLNAGFSVAASLIGGVFFVTFYYTAMVDSEIVKQLIQKYMAL